MGKRRSSRRLLSRVFRWSSCLALGTCGVNAGPKLDTLSPQGGDASNDDESGEHHGCKRGIYAFPELIPPVASHAFQDMNKLERVYYDQWSSRRPNPVHPEQIRENGNQNAITSGKGPNKSDADVWKW